MPFGEGFKLNGRPCGYCRKLDDRWINKAYRLLRLKAKPDTVVHPKCLIAKHGEAEAQKMVPEEEWQRRDQTA